MAQFEQSAATRQAMTDAAQSYLFKFIQERPAKALAAQIGVTPRTVQRWKAFLSGSSAQSSAPNLAKVATVAPSIHVDMVADFSVGDDDSYKRLGKPMKATVSDGESLLQLALRDPDEAWQLFFDEYVIPAGTAENPRIFFR